MEWWCGSHGTLPTLQAQTPELKPQFHQGGKNPQ
jgi:hypothetical protein